MGLVEGLRQRIGGAVSDRDDYSSTVDRRRWHLSRPTYPAECLATDKDPRVG